MWAEAPRKIPIIPGTSLPNNILEMGWMKRHLYSTGMTTATLERFFNPWRTSRSCTLLERVPSCPYMHYVRSVVRGLVIGVHRTYTGVRKGGGPQTLLYISILYTAAAVTRRCLTIGRVTLTTHVFNTHICALRCSCSTTVVQRKLLCLLCRGSVHTKVCLR